MDERNSLGNSFFVHKILHLITNASMSLMANVKQKAHMASACCKTWKLFSSVLNLQRSFLYFVRNALPNMYFTLLHHCGMTYRNELHNTKHMKHTSPKKIHHHLKGFFLSSKLFAFIIQCSKCIGYSLSKKWFHICNNKGEGIHVCCFLTCSFFCIHSLPVILWIKSCNQTPMY